MAGYTHYIKRYHNLNVPTIWDHYFGEKDPDEFVPSGSQMYHGSQGEGKTYTMYYHAMKIKADFPKAILVSNLKLLKYTAVRVQSPAQVKAAIKNKEYDFMNTHYFLYTDFKELIVALQHIRHGKYGVIFLIDEIHQYLHSHDSKSMPAWVPQVFSQQRKQKIVILGSVQRWPDVIKAVRDQIDNLTLCNRIGHLIMNTTVDPETFENNYGELEAPIKKKGFVWLSKKVYEGFDTYQVIETGREILGGNDLAVHIKQDSGGAMKRQKRW